MNREVARIQRAYFFAYYRRIGKEAVREATRRWFASFGSSGFVGILTFVLLLIAGDGLSSALWGLVAFVAAWLLITAWAVITLPPRIERDTQLKDETLRVLSERRHVANELRNHMVKCRMTAQQARESEIQASGSGATVSPPRAETLHQVALLAAHDAEERLLRLGTQTGHPSYESQAIEITGAVHSKKVANVEEAITQLEALAGVIERQLSSAAFW